jgi:hypothetical protein
MDTTEGTGRVVVVVVVVVVVGRVVVMAGTVVVAATPAEGGRGPMAIRCRAEPWGP